MTSWPECEFIVRESAENEQIQAGPNKTGWETVVFVVEDEEPPPGAAPAG